VQYVSGAALPSKKKLLCSPHSFAEGVSKSSSFPLGLARGAIDYPYCL